MIRAIGFMQGLRGDLCMSTVAARSFKEQHPDSHLTLGVGPQFKDLLPLFHNHAYFDAVHAYTTYDNWPGPKDIEYLKASKYDMVFHAMPGHPDQRWFVHRHQYAETAHMVGLPVPSDINPVLTRWFGSQPSWPSNVVAIAPFGGNGGVNDKMLSPEQAQSIVDWLVDHGYSVLHLGGPDDPILEDAEWLPTCYFDSVRNMLSCRSLIHCDTGMGHFAGAYNHPSVGLYAYRYFGKEYAHRVRPLHKNHIAVEAETIDQIDLDQVFKSLKMIL